MLLNTMKIKNQDALEILGFNPVSNKIQVFVACVTPPMAKYILENHNFDNRKIIRSQVNKIRESIRDDGWLEDGQPLTFNTDGNITEAQHRLDCRRGLESLLPALCRRSKSTDLLVVLI